MGDESVAPAAGVAETQSGLTQTEWSSILAMRTVQQTCSISLIIEVAEETPSVELRPHCEDWGENKIFLDSLLAHVREMHGSASAPRSTNLPNTHPLPKIEAFELSGISLKKPYFSNRNSEDSSINLRPDRWSLTLGRDRPGPEGDHRDEMTDLYIRRLVLQSFGRAYPTLERTFLVLELFATPRRDQESDDAADESIPWTVGEVLRVHSYMSSRIAASKVPEIVSLAIESTPIGSFNMPPFTSDFRPFVVTCLTVEGLPQGGDVLLAEALGSGAGPIFPDLALGERSASGLPVGVTRRTNDTLFVASQRSAALVVNVRPDASRYIKFSLSNEFRHIFVLATGLSRFQRASLLHLSARLAEASILATEATWSLEQEASNLQAIERDFQRLLAWFRFHVISDRFSLQLWYDLLGRQFRLDELEREVALSVEGATRLINLANAQADRRARRHLETIVTWGGALFGSATVVLGFYSIQIAGLTAGEEGISPDRLFRDLPLWVFTLSMVTLLARFLLPRVLPRLFRSKRKRTTDTWSENG